MSEQLKIVLLCGVEYVYLIGLWMGFVSKLERSEFYAGLVVALIGTVADAIVKKEGTGHFRPQLRWLLLAFLEPWYVLKGLATAVQVFPAATKGEHSQFKAVPFDAGERDAQSATRRALATMLLTIPADSVVVGIDGHNGLMLLHTLKSQPATKLEAALGVQE